ncbi:phosphatidate cytidylyltransferase [Roseibium hamelinense]|uniref:Phosphatidate cytidylyltransferase n=1 Tax=Roseibium hamelinense TaxID=150831 RepID=A0A562TBW2_9HYPH|nr:phosphatidate cytidylyltransferase [Roseibium hamelinense]MTI45226.1 phosphatidate cytidylyltransferase [Roseibium hamelinense]TWI90410.1 phosphatidate cytidylyltransferase [Roseibium hamelinense]
MTLFPLHGALLGIWAILGAAIVIVFWLSRKNTGKDYSELVQRTKSWWVMIAIFTLCFLVSELLSIIVFALISFLALKEYFSMIPTRRADRRVLFWAYLAIPVQYFWVADAYYGMFAVFIPVYMFLFLPFASLLSQQTEGFLKAVGTLNWGLMLCVFSISHAAFLLILPPTGTNSAGGAGLLLFLLFLTQFNDVAQYTWGKLFGKRKIIPGVSPNKTWEGFLGGVGTTLVLAVLTAPILTPFSWEYAAAAGVLIALAGFVGDVTVSALKRDLGIKDAGSLIPGHGGILDRIDSLTFTAPLFFHFTRYFFY